MKTYTPKANEIEEKWYVVDAADQVLGRLASRVAHVLRGKNDPHFTPHANMRNHVIVINTEKIRLTGKKWEDKMYYRHSGWVGGIRSKNARQIHAQDPTDLVRKAVWGMLPHTRLGRATMKRLRLIADDDYSRHAGQKPEEVQILKTRAEKKA